MSWRFLLFWAAVIVVLFGGTSVVFSSGTGHQTAPGSSSPRRAEQEVIASPTPYLRAELRLEGQACSPPTLAPDAGELQACMYVDP